MAEASGQQTLDFLVLVKKAAEAAVSNVREICETAPDLSDTEKKIALLKYILKTRQRLLRLVALSKWCRQIPLVERCQQLAGTLSNHDMSFTQAADFLFYLHDTLQQARAPVYDIATAADIFVTGNHERLPECIMDLGTQPLLTGGGRASALLKLNSLLRSRLLDSHLPRRVSDMQVTGGRVIVHVAGEFEAHLTLGYRGNLSLWRVLKLDVLVGEPSGPVQFTDSQRFFLGNELEQRMAASDDPLGLLYSILHQFCTALVMDTLFRQAKVLQGGRWRDAIKYEKSTNTGGASAVGVGQGVVGQAPVLGCDVDTESGGTMKVRVSPGLKIVYWLDLQKVETPPSLMIEYGVDKHITCSHCPPVIDPSTGNEAVLVVDSSCIHVEKLLLRAIACNVHSRLLEVQQGLKGGTHLWWSDSDVLLRHSISAEKENSRELTFGDGNIGGAEEEVVCVRVFGISYMELAISIRSGRFLLRCPSMLLAPSLVKEMEEALNLTSFLSLDIFVNLRTKCLLHYFASIGRSLNLKVYEQGASTVKLPADGPKLGADVLIMGFPQCGDSFFLCVQLDSKFSPLFTLLEAQPQSLSCRKSLMSSPFNIFRWMKIDIELMPIWREDASFCVLDQSGHEGAGNQKLFQTSSPPAIGDIAASPIDLDDEDLSKLIDSISSRTPQSSSLGCISIIDGSTSSRQVSALHQRNVEMSGCATWLPTARSLLGKGHPQHGSQPVWSSQANIPGWNSIVPLSVPSKIGTALLPQEWIDVELQGKVGMRPLQGVSDQLSKGAHKRKWSVVELFSSLPSLQVVSSSSRREKCRKTGVEVVRGHLSKTISILPPPSSRPGAKAVLTQVYGNVIWAANQGKACAGAYRAVFSQVDRQCRLCIKHACLTRQMDAQGIPHVNEVGLREPSTVLRFRLPATVPTGDSRTREIGVDNSCGWQQMCVCLGKPGSEDWYAEVTDSYFSGLWELQREPEGVPGTGDLQFASPSQDDAHMQCTHEGVVLKYSRVEENSVTKLVNDLERIWRTRAFAIGIRKVLGSREEEKKLGKEDWGKAQWKLSQTVDRREAGEKKWGVLWRAFRVEAVGLTSVSFTHVGSMPGVVVRFVVEWGGSRRGCIVHSPEQLWPHTKFLEDYINGGEVELLLDAIQVTAGPLHALAAAIRPARMAVPSSGSNVRPSSPRPGSALALKPAGLAGSFANPYLPTGIGLTSAGQGRGLNCGPSPTTSSCNSISGNVHPVNLQSGGMASNTGRSSGPGLVPSSLLPTDVSVLLRSTYWIRIVYRGDFAIDMRCFAGDQVWLQPAPPTRNGSKSDGGSLPCPQFRTFVVEHVTLGMSSAETMGGGPAGLAPAMGSTSPTRGSTGATNGPRFSNQVVNRAGNTLGSGAGLAHGVPAASGAMVSSGTGRYAVSSSSLGSNLGFRGELNPALVGMGDDGGYGGAWVPLAALKKVLRGTLRYLGGLWLFAQFPTILKEVLHSTMRENEGALLNHDPEQPALRFFIRGCVFAVSMHRQQLFLQAINVKRYQQQQALSASHQLAVPGQAVNLALELSPQEMSEIGDFFARRVASEPYDASRLASFVTMLTLPVPVLREFLGLIQWKKEAIKVSGGLHGPAGDGGGQGQSPCPRAELSLESPVVCVNGEDESGHRGETGILTGRLRARSSIQHNHQQSTVTFTLTFSFEAFQVPHLNVAGGAGWLPQSVALRLTYLYAEGSNWISLSNLDGSHGGRSCWARADDWERCRERVNQVIQSATGEGPDRLRELAEAVQMALQNALLQIGKGPF